MVGDPNPAGDDAAWARGTNGQQVKSTSGKMAHSTSMRRPPPLTWNRLATLAVSQKRFWNNVYVLSKEFIKWTFRFNQLKDPLVRGYH